MTRTTIDLRRAVEGLRVQSMFMRFEEGVYSEPLIGIDAVRALLPEGDEPVYLVTAGELAAALSGYYASVDGHQAGVGMVEAILSRLGGGE